MGDPKTDVVARIASIPDTLTPKLTVVRGPSAGRALALSKPFMTVGRHPTNHLVLADPRVSGVHLEVRRLGHTVSMRDAGTTNGTWLGPNRVLELEVALDTELTIGDSVLRLESDAAAEVPPQGRDSFGHLVGASAQMREVFTLLERVSSKDLTLLLQGETGTGKEEVARAVHEASPRASAPFVVIDATSIPESIAESLLFGHERGAFTGATERRVGFFEAAHGGTVFIDEVGELPLPLQAKFLRVLERKEVVRVGSHQPVPVDVRVLAATHRDLRNDIDAGKFREDLYYRLSQVRVFLPALRERREDLPLLCRRFLEREHPGVRVEADALEYLAQQPFPGNLRELKNALLRAAALAAEGVVTRAELAGEGVGFGGRREEKQLVDVTGTFSEAKERAVERFELVYLSALMRRSRGNLSRASKDADLARHYLRELLKRRGLYGITFGDDE